MLIHFPVIGSQFRLTSDWRFNLMREHRNMSLVAALGQLIKTNPSSRYSSPHRFTEIKASLPAGTVLQVDRIYIRKGAEDFDSITFYVVDSPDERFLSWGKGGLTPKYAVRFWTKVADINGKMDAVPVENVKARVNKDNAETQKFGYWDFI